MANREEDAPLREFVFANLLLFFNLLHLEFALCNCSSAHVRDNMCGGMRVSG